MAAVPATPIPFIKSFWLDNNGNKLNGGLLFAYAGGTTTKQNTYNDSSSGTANANPVVLDANGRADVFLDPTLAPYKFVLSPSTDSDPPTNAVWTEDQIWPAFNGGVPLALTSQAINETSVTIASAATVAIGAAKANYIFISGITTITAFDTVQSGVERTLEFQGALTLTNNNTSLILPDSLNITTAAGDVAKLRSEGFGNWRLVSYLRKTGGSLIDSAANSLKGNNTGSTAAAADLTAAQVGTMLIGNVVLRSYLAGLTLSNDSGTPNTVIDISAGIATDSTNASLITLSAFTKTTVNPWVAGSGNAGMTVAVGNNQWIHVFAAIVSGAADAFLDTDAGAAHKPAGTTAFRRIGSILTDGSAHILAFTQHGDEFWWSTPPALDKNSTGTTANRTLTTVTVPLGVIVKAFLNMRADGTSGDEQLILLTDPANADVAPADGLTPLCTLGVVAGAAVIRGSAQASMWTNTSSQVGVRVQQSTDAIQIQTIGWLDYRGRFN